MAVAGALIGGAIGAFGTKPKIPTLPSIDPNMVEQNTVSGNQATLPGAEQLGRSVDTYNLDELSKALNFWFPGGLSKIQGIIGNQLSGTLSPDTSASVIRNATAAGFSRGVAGSQFGHNLVARDLGLTAEGLQQQGMSNLLGLYSATPKPYDVTQMFFTPQQRLSFELTDREQHFQRDLLAAQVEAAPDPATAALGKEVDRFFNTIASYGMMAAGGGGGGGVGGMG